MRDVVFCETPDDVADAAADLIFESQRAAVEERGVYHIALSGGKTPALLYDLLSSEEWEKEMRWEEWEVWWSDERAVSPDHIESNFHLAKNSLLDFVPIGEIWRMPADAADLKSAADEYARLLRSRLGPGAPIFDTILLGMGADGHTASLFPGHPALQSAALVESVDVIAAIRKRLTLTLPVINDARRVIFLITGAEKAERVRDILSGENTDFPVAQVTVPDGECYWLLDEAAASLIR